MANEISVNLSVECTNGLYRTYFAPDQLQIDQSTVGAHDAIQIVGTSQEAMVFGDVSVPGVTVVQNLDSTNYVEIGVVVSATFYPLLKIPAGRFQFVHFASGVTPYARANTASVNLRKLTLET